MELFYFTIDHFSFLTYNWSLFAYNFSFFSSYSWSFFAYSGKVSLIRALRDLLAKKLNCKQKNSTVSKKASPFSFEIQNIQGNWVLQTCHPNMIDSVNI